MHGLSTSGQTSYVEPLAVIDQNNDLVRVRESEEIEIARILLEITEALRSQLPALRVAVDTIEEIDFAQAKARLAEEFSCSRPQITSERRLRLEDARHPLLEHMLRQSGSQAVPVSFEMDESHPVMVISGPNAGGKTVVLKTTGLLTLMAQMGLHVPARAATLPVFRQVFADIGDQQSIAANLSTFTAHMRNVSGMARRVSPPALVLIDEVGTGTDPDEGAALAVAIVDYFRRAGAATIATTHYNKLKMWASQTAGVLNASVEFDERTLQPTYRLLVGIAGASSGLEIAKRMAVPGEIVDQARALHDPAHSQASDYLKRLKSLVDEQESLNIALEDERRITAERYAQLDAEFARREARRRQEFESEVARVIREFAEESRQLLATINDRALAARIKKQIDAGGARLRRSAETKTSEIAARVKGGNAVKARGPAAEPVADATAEIGVGDRVLVRTLNQQGVVESLRGENYTVTVGSLKFRAGRGELQLIEAVPEPKDRVRGAERGIAVLTDSDKAFSPELKVIGMAADEALDRVDKFLDAAYLADAESVRIIHGHGKGILRRAISKFLAEHPLVERFELAPPDQGGGGATLVSLRKD
jgi:DNA mismatch repair protein MutS2